MVTRFVIHAAPVGDPGMLLTGLTVAAGIAAALALAQLFTHVLYGIGSNDLATFT